MSQREAYLDIVWRQFRKNRFALVGPRGCWRPLFLLATFAPLWPPTSRWCSTTAARRSIPGSARCSIPSETVDFVFNMALVGFLPWLVAAAG